MNRTLAQMLTQTLLAACTTVICACSETTTGPGETVVPPPNNTPPYPRLVAFGVGRLGMAPRGDTTPYNPSVRVVDDRGHAISSVVVHFAVVSGGGTIERTESLSSIGGFASAGLWRLGGDAGRNVIRATSPSSVDTVYLDVEGVDVDASRSDGRFELDQLHGMTLPAPIPDGFGGNSHLLLSASIEIQGARFRLTWRFQQTPLSNALTTHLEGSIRPVGAYLMLLMDGTNATDYYAESPAMMLADGRLRIDNFAWDWQFFGNYWDFKRVR